MSNFIDKTIITDEIKSLSNYLLSRHLTYLEVSVVLNLKLDEDRFVTAVQGTVEAEKYKKNHSH